MPTVPDSPGNCLPLDPTFDYAGLMQLSSCRQWEPGRSCTFAAWNYHNARPGPPHNHDFHELFWVTAGRGIHWVAGEPRPMSTGYLVLIRPEDAHTFSGGETPEGVSFFNFAFLTRHWRNLVRRHPHLRGRFFDPHPIGRREFQLGPAALERLRLLSADLASGAYDDLTAESFLQSVLSMLEHLDRDTYHTEQVPPWLAEALRQILTYPEFVGGVPRFVTLSGRTHEHLARSCRLHLGRSPREIVAEARLRWAAALASSTDKKIIEIALDCGFENLGHFYKLFRRYTGMTPETYRKSFAARAPRRV